MSEYRDDRERLQADLLEQYWAQVTADPTAPPPEGLDPHMAELARALAAQHMAPGARPAAAADLRRRLDAQAAELARRRRSWRPAWPGLPALGMGVRLALAVLLAVLAIGVYAVVSRPAPVSALEVLQKAQASAGAPESGGVRSFVLRQTSREWPATPARGGVTEIVIDSRRWYGGPGHWRVVSERVLRGADGAELGRQTSLEVADGTDLWRFDSQANVVTVDALTGHEDSTGSVSAYGQGLAGLQELLAQADRCFDPTVTGRETVAGRAVYRIDLGPNRCPIAGAPEFGGRQVLWVDQETAFILRYERYLPGSDKLAESMEVAEVQYNGVLGGDLFTFTPPAGSQVVDNRPKPAPGPEEYLRQLVEYAAAADFTLLVPRDVPRGLVPRRPRLDPLGENAWQLMLEYVPPAEVDQAPRPIPEALTIVETRATDEAVMLASQGMEPVDVPGADAAWLQRGTLNPDGTGTSSVVIVRHGDALVGLNSMGLTVDELLQVAAALEVVER